MHQILPGTRILAHYSAAARTTPRTSLITRSRPTRAETQAAPRPEPTRSTDQRLLSSARRMIWSDSGQTMSGSGRIVTVMDTGHPAVVPVTLRPPARGDLPRISAMWERCSLPTRIARFHAPVRDIPAGYLERVLSDPATSLVAVQESSGTVAALASLIPGRGGYAELGVLVEDAWQRRGIGRRLVAHLMAAASARQITELTASVLAQNAKVADLLRQVPGEFSLTRDGTTVNVRVRLASARPRP